ncbi:Sip1p Ecym_4065 [Eremothecium cymbalariae DBVPG|uniref:Association with the SNF1 complex (ASC) domain-containing protein n=1 Tax=Eremothecium cymbalariae (strain CBS 270.75 / DBVPG 7215 / KCTC 17166 / NRRL Y-17582) TaxID=931890 RepID=G8JSZ2_ERECY|nr:hypothetical protein Ecym_4065 [Eremothecium cymbalariae DBVPG\
MGNTTSSTDWGYQKVGRYQQQQQQRRQQRQGVGGEAKGGSVQHGTKERVRQQSITSQLFPGRHQARSKWKSQRNVAPGAVSGVGGVDHLFKRDYSLSDDSSAVGMEGVQEEGGVDLIGMPNVAGLKLDSRAQAIMSPGPSSATVEHSKLEASISPELAAQVHRPSIVALKQNLIQGHMGHPLHSPLRDDYDGDDDDGDTAPSSSYVPSATIDIPYSNPSTMNTLSIIAQHQEDYSTRSSAVSISTQDLDGYIENSDVVLSEALVDSVVKNDMRRKRQLQKQSAEASEAINENKNEANQQPDVKKAKVPMSNLLKPSKQMGTVTGTFLPQSELKDSGSFEYGSVQHVEVAADDNYSDDCPERVQVIIKWRDTNVDPRTSKISIISSDIASVVQPTRKRKKIPMVYLEQEQCWAAEDLKLPAGIYKLMFFINGQVRHSNYLPTATDSLSNIVNWFEVVPGYDQIEPYRDAAIERSPNELAAYNETSLLLTNETPSPANIRPPLINRGTSSSSRARVIERTNTPISDYTGVLARNSCSNPAIYRHKSNNSTDVDILPKQPTLIYSSDVPELFKVGNASTGGSQQGSDKNKLQNPSKYLQDSPNFMKNVQDCNQDELFHYLQEKWNMNAQEAEEVFLEKYSVPDLPIYLNSTSLNEIFNKLQQNSAMGDLPKRKSLTHIIPHVNLNHLLTSNIRDEIISVGCTTRYEGKFITQIMYAPCYYENYE